jgi:hypothetical protein
MNNGRLQSFRVPFWNPSLSGIVEYIVVDQGYHQFMSLNGPNWEVDLGNTFALSAAICGWTIWQCSRHGFFQNANFHTLESEARHMTSMQFLFTFNQTSRSISHISQVSPFSSTATRTKVYS